MQHTAKGQPKIVKQCSLPLTSVRPVDLVVTELAVIGFPGGRATLLETAPGVTVEQVREADRSRARGVRARFHHGALVRARLRSLEQLMPFATAGELIAREAPAARQRSRPSATALAALRDNGGKGHRVPAGSRGEKLVGVVSERDIARGVILHHRTAVREIMTTHVHTVAPETKLPECVTLMHREPHPPSSGGERRQPCSACSRCAT